MLYVWGKFIMATNSGNNSCSRNTGTVKWFNDAKGYGFITQDSGGEELFAHFSAIAMSGFKSLKEGQRVAFGITKGTKGLQATEIQPLGSNDGSENFSQEQNNHNNTAVGEASPD
jgi:CspA family cold shock protein